jgi:hypothetical protein
MKVIRDFCDESCVGERRLLGIGDDLVEVCRSCFETVMTERRDGICKKRAALLRREKRELIPWDSLPIAASRVGP